MTTMVLSVPDISCGHCVTAITDEVTKLAGVEGVSVSVEHHTVTITGDVDQTAVVVAIGEAGYEVEA